MKKPKSIPLGEGFTLISSTEELIALLSAPPGEHSRSGKDVAASGENKTPPSGRAARRRAWSERNRWKK